MSIMSFFKKRDASSLYQEAREAAAKGEHRKASILFEKAARLYQKEGDKKLFHKATVNAFIHEYKHAKERVYKANLATKIIRLLQTIEEIEDMEKPYNTVPASFLREKFLKERSRLMEAVSEQEWAKIKEPQSLVAQIESAIAREGGEKEWVNANKLLALYLRAKDGESQIKIAERLCHELSKLQKIERFPPLENRYVEVDSLIDEIKARIKEVQALKEKDFEHRASLYAEAAALFERMGERELLCYKYMMVRSCKESSKERHILNMALSKFWETFSKFYKDSKLEEIKEGFLEVRQLFTESGESAWIKKVNNILEHLSREGKCWFCQRSVWGFKVNFDEYKIFAKDVETIIVCKVCSTLLQKICAKITKRR